MNAAILFACLNLVIGPQSPTETPSAEQILAKSAASYDALKSYQGTMMVLTESGDLHEKLILKIKAVNGSDSKIIRSVGEMNHTSTHGGVSQSTREKQIDDGVTVFSMRGDLKNYSRRAHSPERLSSLFTGPFGDIAATNHPFIVNVIRYDGKPVYELSSRGKDVEMRILIEKDTYHLRRIWKSRSLKNAKATLEVTASDERFNEAIPDSTFKWSVPPGFTEVPGNEPGR